MGELEIHSVSWSFRDAWTKQNKVVKNIYIPVCRHEKKETFGSESLFKDRTVFHFIIIFNS